MRGTAQIALSTAVVIGSLYWHYAKDVPSPQLNKTPVNDGAVPGKVEGAVVNQVPARRPNFENGSPSYVYSPGRNSTFHGYDCTEDCSGHEAGYNWAEENDISDEDDCGGNSNSFIEGCKAYVEEQSSDESDTNSSDDADQDDDDRE